MDRGRRVVSVRSGQNIRNTPVAQPENAGWLRRDSLALLRVNSPLNEETVSRLESEARIAVEAGHALTVDLTSAEYVDSDGIRWLRRLRQALPDGAPAPRLRFNPSSGVERTLRLALEGEDFAFEPLSESELA
jgi:anti-anti-sigma regulatory factor